ncbi:hypothetical protein [Nonomuraea sp. NPDC050691]|uniref:hypothetical protein n=1 Tax=Nonomuraea sp. NPDC050691 TaxID=3155661 RepID=UPI0033E29B95
MLIKHGEALAMPRRSVDGEHRQERAAKHWLAPAAKRRWERTWKPGVVLQVAGFW